MDQSPLPRRAFVFPLTYGRTRAVWRFYASTRCAYASCEAPKERPDGITHCLRKGARTSTKTSGPFFMLHLALHSTGPSPISEHVARKRSWRAGYKSGESVDSRDAQETLWGWCGVAKKRRSSLPRLCLCLSLCVCVG